MLTDEEKKHILNKFLKNISHIADKAYQKRVWIYGIGPEIDDFDEACCRFFDDGDSVFENYEDFWITDSQHQILKRFRNKFEDFASDKHFPHEFIDTPEWAQIMGSAKDVLKAFNYSETMS
jgi:hypothetical protein